MLRSVMSGVNERDRVQPINLLQWATYSLVIYIAWTLLYSCILTESTERLFILIKYGGDPSSTEEITGYWIVLCIILNG